MILLLLLGLCHLTYQCHENWYNKCKGNGDCCSDWCYRGEGDVWAEGVCKPKPEEKSAAKACHQNWYKFCKDNDDCCSGWCFLGEKNDWADGTCKPKQPVQVKSTEKSCHQNWYKFCKVNDDCCSGWCFRGEKNDWADGTCKPKVSTEKCHKNWYKYCKVNGDCCSGQCYRGDDNSWADGTCKPRVPPEVTKLDVARNGCLKLWNNTCRQSFECCSGYCFRGPQNDWLYGVCRSREINTNINQDAKCKPVWDNTCLSNAQCCSGYCYKGPKDDWALGVCKVEQIEDNSIDGTGAAKVIGDLKRRESQCKPMFHEGCGKDADCCDRLFCDKAPGIRVGTCKPYTALKLLNEDDEWIECFENWYEYCLDNTQCCSGYCFFGPDNDWRYGACVPDIRILPSSLFNNGSRSRTRSKRDAAGDKRVVCYIGSWANYKPGDGKFVIEDIDPNLCTHLVYGFAKLESNKIVAFDPWLDLSKNESGGGLDAFARFNKLKEDNPGLKTLIAIGGWNEGSEKYSQMASSGSTIDTFVDSVVDFLNKYGFDGLDVDWEYPSTRGGAAHDKENLNNLLRSLRSKLSENGKLLTMAVSANPRTVESGYDVPTVASFVDYISVMSYDYHGAFDNVTGHNAPLYGRPDDQDQTFHVAYGIDCWLEKGVPAHKLNMGLPLYGRAVELESEDDGDVAAPLVGPGEEGVYSTEPGVLYYREICQLLKEGTWDVQWDTTSMVPYMRSGSQWITFDTKESLGLKVAYAMSKGLGGIMVWSLESDDYKDICKTGQYVLLNNARNYMRDSVVELEQRKKELEEKDDGCSESGVDSIPVLSQLKSFWEWITGHSNCAKKTQENFVRKAPGISQITSLVQAASGDKEAARETQMMFLKNLEQQVDGTPGLGHIKAGVHCALKQYDKCKEVNAAATRPLVVAAGGVAGAAVGGPAGAVAGGLAAGATFDGVHTGVESAINKKYSPQGIIGGLQKIATGEASPSEQFDTAAGVLGDALGGRALSPKSKPGIKPKKNVRCRRAGNQCQFFNDVENFDPVNNLRVHTIRNPIAGGPITRVQKNVNGRIEFVDATILTQHLQIKDKKKTIQKGTGSATNKDTRDFSKSMNVANPKGAEPNDAGHIIGNQLGGSGTSDLNIFPQSRNMNRGTWKNEVETLVYNEVNAHGRADFTVKLIYDNDQSTRPNTIRYWIRGQGQELKGDLDNPRIQLSDLSFLRSLESI